MRTVVMGAGRSGLAAARFLAGQGRSVVITDLRPEPSPELELELTRARVAGVWGDHPLALLEACEELVISPGIPRTAPFVAEALRRGIPVLGEVELAHRVIRARPGAGQVLAITGTNGKSTTTDLTAFLLRAAGHSAAACGNLGTPVLEAAQSAPADTTFVVELSSYQLESIQAFHAEETMMCLRQDLDMYFVAGNPQFLQRQVYGFLRGFTFGFYGLHKTL